MGIITPKLTNEIVRNLKTGAWVENIVYGTYEYNLFNGNAGVQRQVKESIIKGIVESINIQELAIPILVNENFSVIDGHHLLQARMQLKLPILYTVLFGYGEKEVRLANSYRRNWQSTDLLKYYNASCNLNVYPYIELLCEKHKIPSSIVNIILPNDNLLGSNTRQLQKQLHQDDISQWASIDTVIHRISIFERYKKYMGNNRLFLTVLYQNPELDCQQLISGLDFTVNTKMLSNIKKQSDMKTSIIDIIKKLKGKK